MIGSVFLQIQSSIFNMRHVVIESSKGTKRFDVPSVESWERITKEIRSDLRPGMMLALSGPLGAGKTTFVQTLAKALGIVKPTVSPTFSLLRSYRLPKPVNGITRLLHVDAYRIEHESELLPLDLDAELSDQETILVLEWPEQVPRFVDSHANRLTLTLS
jgi:tRNA threonylcarbamoyladenosine biosynthesis protein TsaE